MKHAHALRAGAVAVLAAGLLAVAAPAHAADGPDVAVTPISLHVAKGVKKAKAKPFQVELRNFGNAPATGVVVTVKLSELEDLVGFVKPQGCEKAGKATYTCAVGDIAAGQDVVIGVPLFNASADTGYGGYFTVSAAVAGDTQPANNSADVDVTVEDQKTYDLTVWAQDVYATVVADGDDEGEESKSPVPAGGTAPLDSAIFNHGGKRVVGVAYVVTLPDGATVASAPEGCEPLGVGELNGNGIACEDDEVVLKPGEVLLPEITLKVADSTPAGVLNDGIVYAVALDAGGTTPEEPGDEARTATKAQKKELVEADDADNQARFDIFVGAAASPSPTPGEAGVPGEPGEPGTGGGGGLALTGPAAGIIGGVGFAVVLVGGALFFVARRRRIVTVTPDN